MKNIYHNSIKILFIADTHLGFDLPMRPRIDRRRRGDDFFKNYNLALQPAFKKEVDLVIHGGDMLFRSRVHPKIVNDAFDPLLRIAEQGIPVFIVPGNHERSNIPQSLFETHRLIHIFNQPKTFYQIKNGIKLSLAGFPYYRKGIRKDINKIVGQTKHKNENADIKLLCMHHIVEGAQVGVQNYTFRTGEDVIQGEDIPGDFLAVLSGHIHRCQVLTKDLTGRLLAAPVIYSGAVERTSFAERVEQKGYFIIEVSYFQDNELPEIKWTFHELPTRPMSIINLNLDDVPSQHVISFIKKKLAELNPHSIVQLKFQGRRGGKNIDQITSDQLRSIAPATMNIEIAPMN